MAIMRKRSYEKQFVQILNETARAVEEKNNPNPISLEALGLLVNLWSYDISSWDLHKTELYKRYAKNKKTSVTSAWNELVQAKYIHEFKFRNGRSWEYVYYYRPEPFTPEEIAEIEQEIVEEYGLSSTSDFQQLKFNSSNSTVQKPQIINKESTQDKLKKEKPKKKGSSIPITDNKPEIELSEIIEDEKGPFEGVNISGFKKFVQEFQDNFPNVFDNEMYNAIFEQMNLQELRYITYEEAVKQAKYMKQIEKKGKIIADYAAYFVGGIIKKRPSEKGALAREQVRQAEERAKERRKSEESYTRQVPFYNWLEQ